MKSFIGLTPVNLHEMAGRATPDKMMSYKLALQLYRTFNDQTPTQDWLNINFNAIRWFATLLEHVNNEFFCKVLNFFFLNSFLGFKPYNVEIKVIRWWPNTGYNQNRVLKFGKNVYFHEFFSVLCYQSKKCISIYEVNRRVNLS